MNKKNRVLITGASGMLGSEIVSLFEANKDKLNIEKILKHRQQKQPGFISLDLKKKKDLEQISNYDWNVIIHTAANRNPDLCAENPDNAVKINYEATAYLAKEAARRKAYMIYISTDYVFDGKNPPYNEDSKTNPINLYGETKLSGEKALLSASEKNCSLRVPFLYGIKAGIEQAPMLSGSIKAIKDNSKKYFLDNVGVRYPTFTGDVADAVMLLLKKCASGIFHCSGEDKMTKYTIALAIAKYLNLPSDHIIPLMKPATTKAERPHNTHLITEKLKAEGWNTPLPLNERIKQLLNNKQS